MQIQFTHDFDLNYSDTDNRKKQLADFQEKYGRRIERFRKLREYPGKVFFRQSNVVTSVRGKKR